MQNPTTWTPIPGVPYAASRNRLSPSEKNCAIDASRLAAITRQYDIGDQFDYFTRTVSFQRNHSLERKSMTIVSQQFLSPNTITFDATKQNDGAIVGGDCFEPLQVEVTASGLPSTVDASDLIFGISTTFERLNESRSEIIGDWEYWLTNGHGVSNGAKLFVTLFEATDIELRLARKLLHGTGIDATVDRSDDRDMPVRYINLVPYLYRQEASRHRKWIVLCDDDTFFPSMHGLVQRLRSFDHSKQLYIGALSEDVGAIERHGSQAFGGAGVFLSSTMAKTIAESISGCTSAEKVDEAGWQGDKLLRNCIYENSETRLVALPDLWQLDFRGDPAGFYEWGHKPLSLHHYRGDGWHTARPAQFSKIAHVCGEDCILQRFQTADNFIISGHSIAYYPRGITFETSQVEQTFEALWDKDGWNFDFVFGPQRPPLKSSGRKISWEIQGSEVRSDGSVWQTYLRRKDHLRWNSVGDRRLGDLDSVIELIWVPWDTTT
ncbi:uncharacterized protein F5Z01DRAFT_628182 [Emericellopsis atlantica]|uniref:Fringe-like glycosyltransferase domain-containing protein n=1 Tax=Emericellopsis atlantica TaxID=2614577 RepID=A0A9P8CL63_9HYPO|nr:uncharacterized protein F5Z01DRAFT_628182 [Emericellopsis atlantica]KAG9251068.1 hypothetical protein F5Z01DRAFT_628182 [Emericellopsis atlantica]